MFKYSEKLPFGVSGFEEGDSLSVGLWLNWVFNLVLLRRCNCNLVNLLIQQTDACKSKAPLLIIKKEKTSSSPCLPTFCSALPTAIINVSVEHVLTSCYYCVPSDLLLYQNKTKCSRHQSQVKFTSGSPVYLLLVEVNLAAVPWYSKPATGDGVHTAVYLWGGGAGGGSLWGYNSSAVCGGLAKPVLDHTALFLRGLRSCDSAFLFSAWPLTLLMHIILHCAAHTDACKQKPTHV